MTSHGNFRLALDQGPNRKGQNDVKSSAHPTRKITQTVLKSAIMNSVQNREKEDGGSMYL
jgi:hypothetical protein